MSKHQLSNTIRNRRSVRSYFDIHIPEDDLNDILESGLYAPSGKSRQPWRFVIINNSEIIKTIAKTMVYSRFVRNAPILILVLASTNTEYPLEKDMISIGACLQNILLTATEKGYGSCIIGELYNRAEILGGYVDFNINDYLLVCGIVIGVTKSIPKQRSEFKLKDFKLNIVD